MRTFDAATGQSFGKRAEGLRIVLADGRPPGFLRGVVLRSWLFAPTLVSGLWALDAVTMFLPDRRCVHDRLVGTRVVAVPGTAPGNVVW